MQHSRGRETEVEGGGVEDGVEGQGKDASEPKSSQSGLDGARGRAPRHARVGEGRVNVHVQRRASSRASCVEQPKRAALASRSPRPCASRAQSLCDDVGWRVLIILVN